MILPAHAAAQEIRLAPDAEVRSIEFHFTGPHELRPDELSDQIATTGPGTLHRLHATVAWIPFVPDPAQHPFDPYVLQEDIARLRRYYRQQGFLAARVDYEVKADEDRHLVSVRIDVEEGEPLRLRSLALVGPDGTSDIVASDLHEEIQKGWEGFQKEYVGRRYSEKDVGGLQERIGAYFVNRGYARVAMEPRAVVDSAAHQVDFSWMVDLKARTRFAAIRVEGLTRVPEHIVTRQLGFEAGDWTSRKAIERGRANVLSVDLFRAARLDLDKAAPADSGLPVRVVVKEDHPRFTTVEGGYATDGAGVSGQVRWTHPNFTGGARSLNIIALFQTGFAATSDVKDRLFRSAIILNQPYLGAPALSMGFGPSFEFRDGHIDRSTAWSVQNTLVWRFNALQSVALRYEYTYRQVDESEIQDLLRNGSLAESLAVPLRTSLLSVNTSIGRLDDMARPQHGLVIKPLLSITAPAAWGTVEFGKADMQATAFAPLPGRSNAVMFRGKLGGLWPFGRSIPEPGENPAVELLRLRDYTLTAGGADDVRGYGTRMLGPKVPAVERTISGTDTTLTSDHYVEAGGLRRWTGSVELRLGFPQISRDVFAHVFGDAGRVWTSDSRFEFSQIENTDEVVHFATGAGLGYYTPVGAIRFDVGYKLNPSVLDLRDPQDVLDAVLAGRSPDTAPIKSWSRYAFHLALGLYF
ncbi:MAG: BamA/OMP85 family outer membrane protein [Candidatus Eiseniibacteriota bacterium]